MRSFPVIASASGVLQVGNGKTFVLRAPFSQNEDVLLASGQAATVSVDAIPGSAFPAKVASIETSATQVGGVSEYYAEIQLGTTDPRLRSGQTGSVNVTVAFANNVLAVPSVGVVHRTEQPDPGRCLVKRAGIRDTSQHRIGRQ